MTGSPDGLRHFPAHAKSPIHTVEFEFAVVSESIPGISPDLLEDAQIVIRQLLGMIRGEFAQLDRAESANLFPLQTTLRVDPTVAVILTANMPELLATLRLGALDFGVENDSATIALGLSPEAAQRNGYAIKYLIVFDVNRLKIKAAKLAAATDIPWTDAFLPVLSMSIWHECFGHLPMSLVEREKANYIANERQATVRGIRAFEWYIDFFRNTKPAGRGQAVDDHMMMRQLLEQVLAAERALQKTYESLSGRGMLRR